MKRVLPMMLLALALPVSAAPKPDWKAFAACAAAYRVNAAIADPSRSTSMKAQISETGDDYETAAVARYKTSVKADDAAAKATVHAYAEARKPAFARQKREQVEKFIDACPQTEE
jgi:hypothetical protein